MAGWTAACVCYSLCRRHRKHLLEEGPAGSATLTASSGWQEGECQLLILGAEGQDFCLVVAVLSVPCVEQVLNPIHLVHPRPSACTISLLALHSSLTLSDTLSCADIPCSVLELATSSPASARPPCFARNLVFNKGLKDGQMPLKREGHCSQTGYLPSHGNGLPVCVYFLAVLQTRMRVSSDDGMGVDGRRRGTERTGR